VLERLATLAPRTRRLAPTAMILAAVLTAGTAASAVTMRLNSDEHKATRAAAAPPSVSGRLALPDAPQPAALPPGTTAASKPSATTARVPRPHRLIEATLLITSDRPMSTRAIRKVQQVSGVTATQAVAAGHAKVDGHRALVLGVNPASFRPWTPHLTAASQGLWQSVARGELTASFDMGHEAVLPLGGTVPVRGKSRVPMRVGAFASVGMAGVDGVVSSARSRALGLRERTGVVVSAPHADALTVREAIRNLLSTHVHVSLLREVVVIRDAGEFLTRVQINTILQTAAHEVGKPYKWGAVGPDEFDCSGLVQYAFATAGIRMPRVSQQQWFAGPHINYADARPGDLLFWHNDPTDQTDIDHVAIYAGNGMMLEAPHTGDLVKYVPVGMTNFAGVVRVDPGIAAQI
jgi:peptidoglycan DL-endopeptidase CwlO